ncbi:hypothetical protein [Candidatus Enterococcus clewellii]|uniref:Uncharacterized protein n=1 Tax=Candidatus Enterococcus clewellii TaxID=1834193 RepID=A0A242KAN9_9ENTE|nr:hypothetical protein [Enterococcus sp. 9E7_DIV0242]OTP18233.1 hypothetical protein A5888_000045 [Enterococcus sp. 9E7_DIV0242]
MNDKTKSRQRKGREPSEKVVFIRGNVRGRLLASKLWNLLIIRRVVATTILRNFRNSASHWLASSQSKERLGVIR